MAKSRDAFRTISEVSDVLDTPAHVLRFWESKFKQIKPVKRAGGRRYYRPDDLALLAAIKDLLHEQGHSIKNAQKLIRDTGVKAVVEQGHAILGSDDDSEDLITAPVMPPRAKAPTEHTQTDLFAGAELPESAAPSIETPAPEPEVVAFARHEDPAPETKSVINLPDFPALREDLPSRILATLAHAEPDKVQANVAKIAPLVDRLTALRDEMRHPW